MDVARLRADFPILERKFHGLPLAYLDNAATSQKPRPVLDAVREYYFRENANPHRGVYGLSVEATYAYENARVRMARFLNAPDPAGVIFVRGATEGLNVVATSLGVGLERGDRVLTTVMEHHSNLVPWAFLRDRKGIVLDYLDIDDDGRLRLDQLDEQLRRKPKVVALTHVSNVLGTVNPVRAIADRAHEVGATVVVDAAQSAPHRKVDVQALGADFLAFSGHKMLGPMGIGVLWGRPERLAVLPPAQGGGEMIREVHQDRVEFREPPGRFEAGTPNVGGAIALSAAADYLERIGWEELAAHERQLADRFLRRLRDQIGEEIRLFGPPTLDDREAVFSFAMRGAHPHDVASLLDADAVAVRAGHHCAQPLMERLGVPALTRASPYLYNTPDEIDRLVTALEKVRHLFATPSVSSGRGAA